MSRSQIEGVMTEIHVHDYPVRIGTGALADAGSIIRATAPAHTYAVITDEHVAAHWLATLETSLARAAPAARVLSHAMPAGEQAKTRETWTALTDWMLEAGCGRDTAVVALGGGVVGDVAGFVAATFMRGVPVLQVPTSLLAMVDSAIGGKTGVDTPAGKNLVGAFHRPAAVIIDPATLATLPPAHLRAGLAEVIKHGAIADSTYFDGASRFAAEAHIALSRGEAFPWGARALADTIARSVAIKAKVVGEDELEAGQRMILNAGHTVGHAIERVSHFQCLHGEAVAIGLVVESLLAEKAGIARRGTAQRLEVSLRGAGLPTSLPEGVDIRELIQAMRVDKKSRAGHLAFALLAEIGRVNGDESHGWTTSLQESFVREALVSSQERVAELSPPFLTAT